MSDREASHYPHCRIRREIDGRDCPECAGLDAAIRGARERDDARREVERLQAERDCLVAALRVATAALRKYGTAANTWAGEALLSPEVQSVLPLLAEPAEPCAHEWTPAAKMSNAGFLQCSKCGSLQGEPAGPEGGTDG